MDTTSLSAKQKVVQWLIILSAIPSFIVILLFVSTLANGIYSILSGYSFSARPGNIPGNSGDLMIIQDIAGTVSTFILVLIYWVGIQKNTFISIGFFRGSGWLKEVVLGLVTGAGLLGATFVFLLLTGSIQIDKIQLAVPSLLKYLFVFLLVGINEELLTRGYLLGSIRKLSNKYFALVLVAVLFSLMHIFNDNFSVIPFLNIILAGILLGVVYIYTGRLWFAISLHFIWNFMQGPVLGSQVSGNETEGTVFQISTTGSPLLTGGDFGFEGSLVMTVLMIMLIVALGQYYRKKEKLDA